MYDHYNFHFQVLEKGRSKPKPQTKYGAIFTSGKYFAFQIEAFDPESVVSLCFIVCIIIVKKNVLVPLWPERGRR